MTIYSLPSFQSLCLRLVAMIMIEAPSESVASVGRLVARSRISFADQPKPVDRSKMVARCSRSAAAT